jgi:GNAT superfamily N-acetyltransferase
MSEYKIERTAKAFVVKRLHKKLFPSDHYPKDDDNTGYWLIKRKGRYVGFGVTRLIDSGTTLFLARAGVLKQHQGKGLHKRLLHIRERYGAYKGCKWIITYVSHDNPSSFANLFKKGYESYEPEWDYAGAGFFYFRKAIS